MSGADTESSAIRRTPVAVKQIREASHRPGSDRLHAGLRRLSGMSCGPAAGARVPVREAVTDVIDDGRRHRFRVEGRRIYSLPTDDVRRVGVLHADDVVAGVDVMISPVTPRDRSERKYTAVSPTSSIVTVRRSGALCSFHLRM